MRTILILCYNTLHNDPRVLRQIDALRTEHRIIAAGYSDPGKKVEYIQLNQKEYKVIDFYFKYPLLIRKFFALFTLVYLRASNIAHRINVFLMKNFLPEKVRYEAQYWDKLKKKDYAILANVNADVIIANDLSTLPLAVKLKKKDTRLVFDAHEYSPGENDSDPDWLKDQKPYVVYICKKYFQFVDLMFSVGYSIAEKYKAEFGMPSVVITNASDYVDLVPSSSEQGKVKLIHHGVAFPERHLELMIEAIHQLNSSYSLDLMLMQGNQTYYEKLKKMSGTRVNFIEPVPTFQIPYVLNKYDAGIIFIPPVNFNYEFCLPNKFFESVQGRVALVLGPTKDMVDIAEKYGNAVVAKDFTVSGLKEALQKLDPLSIKEMKLRSDKCASELNSEANAKLMLKHINALLN